MKKTLFFVTVAALALTMASCGKDEPQKTQPQDPGDITGWYSATYKMTINGVDVSFAPIPGRVEVKGDVVRENGIYFYPDNAILAFPPIDSDTSRDYLPIWPVRMAGHPGNYSFSEHKNGASLYVADHHSVHGNLTASGVIENGVLTLTIDIVCPDPTLPNGTQIYPETGEGFRIYHIELTGVPVN